jgi:hypothetical protein
MVSTSGDPTYEADKDFWFDLVTEDRFDLDANFRIGEDRVDLSWDSFGSQVADSNFTYDESTGKVRVTGGVGTEGETWYASWLSFETAPVRMTFAAQGISTPIPDGNKYNVDAATIEIWDPLMDTPINDWTTGSSAGSPDLLIRLTPGGDGSGGVNYVVLFQKYEGSRLVADSGTPFNGFEVGEVVRVEYGGGAYSIDSIVTEIVDDGAQMIIRDATTALTSTTINVSGRNTYAVDGALEADDINDTILIRSPTHIYTEWTAASQPAFSAVKISVQKVGTPTDDLVVEIWDGFARRARGTLSPSEVSTELTETWVGITPPYNPLTGLTYRVIVGRIDETNNDGAYRVRVERDPASAISELGFISDEQTYPIASSSQGTGYTIGTEYIPYETIRVSDGVTTYQEGVDYRINTGSSQVQIVILNGGGIADGTALTIFYKSIEWDSTQSLSMPVEFAADSETTAQIEDILDTAFSEVASTTVVNASDIYTDPFVSPAERTCEEQVSGLLAIGTSSNVALRLRIDRERQAFIEASPDYSAATAYYRATDGSLSYGAARVPIDNEVAPAGAWLVLADSTPPGAAIQGIVARQAVYVVASSYDPASDVVDLRLRNAKDPWDIGNPTGPSKTFKKL